MSRLCSRMERKWYNGLLSRTPDGRRRHFAILILLMVSAHPGAVSAVQETSDTAARAALAFAVDSTAEGPHIYWQDNSTAFVFYLCYGEVVTRRGHTTDSLRFAGFCHDSATHYVLGAEPPAIEPHILEDVPSVFAVSDIHGEYAALLEILKNTGVVDDKLRWNWDDGHLVVLGDIFDRGAEVTECLWFIHRLEREAMLAGGRVHYLLGNHEKMVLRGDLRYVNEKYLSGIVDRTQITYDDLFGPHMELGRWLRSKHIAVKLNDILFVHGGLSPEVVERGLSLDDMNTAARIGIDMYSYEMAFTELPWFLFSSNGPLWYRGYHGPRDGFPQTTSAQLDSILDHYGAETIVVGHSEIPQVTRLYEGRVYAIDVPVERLGSLQGLLWKGGKFYRVLGTGKLEPLPQP